MSKPLIITGTTQVELPILLKLHPNSNIFVTVKGGLFSSIKRLFNKDYDDARILLLVDIEKTNYPLYYKRIIAKDLQTQKIELIPKHRITKIKVEDGVTVDFV